MVSSKIQANLICLQHRRDHNIYIFSNTFLFTVTKVWSNLLKIKVFGNLAMRDGYLSGGNSTKYRD